MNTKQEIQQLNQDSQYIREQMEELVSELNELEGMNMTKAEFRKMLNDLDAASRDPKSHKHGRYHQRKRLYGDYLWHQDRDKFEADYKQYLEHGRF